MDFVSKYFKEYESAFMVSLNDAGIADDLAKQFLPETVSGILYTMKNMSLDKLIMILLSDDPSQLLISINVDTMATNLGMQTRQVNAGLQAIAPVMSMVFKLKSNEIVEETASLAWNTGSVENFSY